jgi:glycosyltransferase involved in cell wall biosynthesis
MSAEASPTYSVVVPVFCEAVSLPELCSRIHAAFQRLGKDGAFEIVFVDDGSTDETPEIIVALARAHDFVRSVNLRRNCGKALALMAGFRHARGAVVITMDGDLQDKPEDIPALLAKLDEGFDLVNGWRTEREDSGFRKLGSRLYNATVKKASGLALHDMNCGFKAYRSELTASLCIYGQYHRYIPLQAALAGFKVTEVPVANDKRKYGHSKYRALRYEGLFDLLSMLFTHKYGLNPLHFFGVVGALVSLVSLSVVGFMVFEQALYWLGFGAAVPNRPLLAMALTGLSVGMVIFFTGFVCDFILHHQIRGSMASILELSIASRTEAGGVRVKPTAPGQ